MSCENLSRETLSARISFHCRPCRVTYCEGDFVVHNFDFQGCRADINKVGNGCARSTPRPSVILSFNMDRWIFFRLSNNKNRINSIVIILFLPLLIDCWYRGLSFWWPSGSTMCPARSFSQVIRRSWWAGQLSSSNRTPERPAPITWIKKDVANVCLNVSSCTHN